MLGGVALSCYGYACYKALDHSNECFRVGIAGSISAIACDSTFHIIDTVNIRSKVVIDNNLLSTNPLAIELNKAKA